MDVRIPGHERVEGVRYATTQHGLELPVIDVTHPSFAITHTDSSLHELRERALAETSRWSRQPAWIRRLIFRLLSRRSALFRALQSNGGTFLSAMNTYLIKLPPQHLASSFATPADRRLAGGPLFLDIRLRLQVTAELLAEQLAADLSLSAPGAPVFLLNIAGGPAMDSLNALILARRTASASLGGRPVLIEVLDLEDEAPEFGRKALEAVRAADGPLATLDVDFRHRRYDWTRPESLREVFRQQSGDAISHGSSEGGLFAYAPDDVIRANLAILCECSSRRFSFSGSYAPDTPLNRAASNSSKIAQRYFQPGVLERLAAETGWKIDRDIELIRTHCIRLVKA